MATNVTAGNMVPPVLRDKSNVDGILAGKSVTPTSSDSDVGKFRHRSIFTHQFLGYHHLPHVH